MEMKPLTAGKLRALGYDPKTRTMRVDLEGGVTLDYTNIPPDTFRRFSTHASPWSFYRDNIEEEFHGTRGAASQATQVSRTAALDALFGSAPTTPAEEPKALPPGLADLFKKPEA